MRMKWAQAAFLLAGAIALAGGRASAQTDVAASVYGAFSGATTGNGVEQSPSNAAGAMLELRHISNPIMGFDVSYSFNRANQVYVPTVSCGLPCGIVTPAAVSADAHELAAAWVASIKVGSFRPFAQGGGGLMLNEPAGSQSSTTSSIKPVFVYGAVLDWTFFPHLGLRFQYRGNLYKAPDVTKLYTSTGAFTRTAEPMIGVYFRL